MSSEHRIFLKTKPPSATPCAVLEIDAVSKYMLAFAFLSDLELQGNEWRELL
jgi:hypothetical protein